VKFLDLPAVLAMHLEIPPDDLDDRDRGLLSEGALSAALHRCAYGPYFEFGGDLAERAALLLRGIIQDHPFVNANKRTGVLATDAFLRLNGRFIEATAEELEAFVLEVAMGRNDLAAIRHWIAHHLTTLMPGQGGW